MTPMTEHHIEPYDGGGLPPSPWTPRNYPFPDMKVGDKLFVTEAFPYFRSAASTYFRGTRKKYCTRMVLRDGKRGCLLTRLA
jgi:hypothetical protein